MAWRIELGDFGWRLVRKKEELQSVEHALLFSCQRFLQIGSSEQLMLPISRSAKMLRMTKQRKAAERRIRLEWSRACYLAGKKPGGAGACYAMLERVGWGRVRETKTQFRNRLIVVAVYPMSVKKFEAIISQQSRRRVDSGLCTQEGIFHNLPGDDGGQLILCAGRSIQTEKTGI